MRAFLYCFVQTCIENNIEYARIPLRIHLPLNGFRLLMVNILTRIQALKNMLVAGITMELAINIQVISKN